MGKFKEALQDMNKSIDIFKSLPPVIENKKEDMSLIMIKYLIGRANINYI